MKAIYTSNLDDYEIRDMYGKSIWDMSVSELYENNLIEVWARLVDENNEED